MEKVWYVSKTLWLNIIAVAAIVLQGQFGYTISPEIQVAILALINIILRAITKQEIVWGRKKQHNSRSADKSETNS